MRSVQGGSFRAFASLFLMSGFLLLLLMPEVVAQQESAEQARTNGNMQTAAPQSGQTPEPVPASAATPNAAEPDSTLRLGVGDLLEVSVYSVPELTAKTRIGNDGNVYLPLIDYVHVDGLTPEEAQALIEKRLSDGGFLKNPHVTVFVAEYASQGASVLGEVTKPGVYPVLGERRLFDLISAAGGFTNRAGRTVSITRRSRPDKPVTVQLATNLTDNPDSNVGVYPGDTIVVRRADIVYVVGDVGRPSGFLMDTGNLTVLQAIALAGGTNRTAKLSEVRIIRKAPSGMQETPIPLKKMLDAKAPDVPMQGDDILFVPSSSRKVLTGRALEAAMQAAAAVSIVAIRP